MEKPQFKVGDVIRNKNIVFKTTAVISRIDDEYYYYKIPDSLSEHRWGIKDLEENCRKLTKLEKALR